MANDVLAKLLEGKDISKVARDLKCSRTTIYKALKGDIPSGKTMLKMQAYFGRSDIFSAQNVQHVDQNKKE